MLHPNPNLPRSLRRPNGMTQRSVHVWVLGTCLPILVSRASGKEDSDLYSQDRAVQPVGGSPKSPRVMLVVVVTMVVMMVTM